MNQRQTPEPLKILIVDDNPADANLLKRQLGRLQDWQITCFLCSQPDQVPLLIAQEEIEIVFIDYLLGTYTGIDLMACIKRAGLNVACVLLTGQGDERIASEAMRAGAFDYLTKGELIRESLDRTLRYVVGRRQTERELEAAWHALEKRVQERTIELEQTNEALRAEIRERSKAESELRKLSQAVEQSPNMVVITDADGVIEYVNPRFTEMSQFSPQEAIGSRPCILQSGTTTPITYKSLWETIRQGQEWRGEMQDRRKDGTMFWVAASIAPVRSEGGAITHYVAMEEDITERKLTEIKMQEAKEQAEIANRAKTELLANMSHELRTPLNAIIGFVDCMRGQLFGPLENVKYQEYAEDIHASATHLLALINDILDVSAIEAGKMRLQEAEFDLSQIAESACRIVRPRAEQNGLVLVNGIEPGTVRLRADERRLKQILLNLLSNAVKFTPEEGKIILNSRIEPGGGLLISVSDTGIGMDHKGIAKALAPFGQVDSSLARKYEGSGLGLPLTVGLVEAHGGHLMIKSRMGEGTTVTVYLPQERLILLQEETSENIEGAGI